MRSFLAALQVRFQRWPDLLTDAVLDEMTRWRGGTGGFEDDVTLIVIEVTNPPSRPRDIDIDQEM